MQKMISAVRALVLVLALLGMVFLVINNYSYVFSRTVKGEILEVERVTQPTAVLGSNTTTGQLYSFAVAVREPSGEIVTSSTEDRQWAVAKKGFCVEAKFYPYPPWDLDKSGTYFNARLLKLIDCHPAEAPAQPAAAPAAAQ
jgi:hypothetical protein